MDPGTSSLQIGGSDLNVISHEAADEPAIEKQALTDRLMRHFGWRRVWMRDAVLDYLMY